MNNKAPSSTDRIEAADKQARVFLLPPHDNQFDRTVAKDVAANMLRESIAYLVQADQTELAHQVLALAQKIESK